MAENKNMTTCQHCGKEMAKSAKTCPSCGGQNKKPIYKKWWFWVIVLIVIIGIGSSSGDEEKETSKNNDSQAEEQQEEPAVGTKENPYGKDELVTVGEVDWKIISAENIGSVIPSGNMFIDDCQTNSGTFIKLTIAVKNNRSNMYTITELPIYDSQGRKFITSSDVSMCVSETIFILDNINPGIEKTFVSIYEVPEDANGFVLEANSTGGITSKETNKYISLGF